MDNHSTSSLNQTLEDFGKPFGSINFDELLENIWGEENQSSLSLNRIEPTNPENGNTQPPILPRQESFYVKTLEEIWSESNSNETQLPNIDLSLNMSTHNTIVSQESLEEITLEDFLVKDQSVKKPPPTSHAHEQKMTENVQNGGEKCDNIGKGNSNNNGLDVCEPSNKRKKRTTLAEESDEWKQRRMVKNRESAARSRARKQAYTMELEKKQKQLKEENTRLKFELDLLKEDLAKAKKVEEKFKKMQRSLSL